MNSVKHSFDGKASNLKLSHLPLNGMVCSVKVDGVEFEVRVLNGHQPKKRMYIARKVVSKVNDFVWDWQLGYMDGLRTQLTYSARIHNEYAARREQFLTSYGIDLK